MRWSSIPQGLLVFVGLALGVGAFFIFQKPHTVCDSQIEVFREMQKGKLFPDPNAKPKKPAIYPRLMESCKLGNSPGSCFELFRFWRALVRDLQAAPLECAAPMGEVAEVKKVLSDGIDLLAQIAWGESAPEPGLSRFGWLESADLLLFCQMKGYWISSQGPEAWEELRSKVISKLPGEPKKQISEDCVECASPKLAKDILSSDEIWVRSLFSARCDQFQ